MSAELALEGLAERVDELETQRDRLRRQLEQEAYEIVPIDDYAEFLEDDDVKEVIEAKQED